MYLINATSWNMVTSDVTVQRRTKIEAPTKEELLKLESAIGHKELAEFLGVAYNRATLKLPKGSKAVLIQYEGETRLPEGATSLPEGSTLSWYEISFE